MSEFDRKVKVRKGFRYPDYTYRIEVKEVIDGDTFDADIDVGFSCIVRKRLQLIDIDAYEEKGEERPLGLKATEKLEALLNEAEELYVKTVMDGEGKHSRVLSYVWAKFPNEPLLKTVNGLMLLTGHATEIDSVVDDE